MDDLIVYKYKLVRCLVYSKVGKYYLLSRSERQENQLFLNSQQTILHPKPLQYCLNYRDKNNSPLDNKCLTPKIVYQADTTNGTDDTYKYRLGPAETSFKDRYRNHISSFNNKQIKNKTEFSKYLWSLKNENKTLIINWKIIKIIYSKTTSEFCKLCLMEKLYILNALGDGRCFIKRTEFMRKCRHQNKFLLKSVKDIMD